MIKLTVTDDLLRLETYPIEQDVVRCERLRTTFVARRWFVEVRFPRVGCAVTL